MSDRRGVAAAAFGCGLFVVACALPWIGIFRGHLGTSLFQSYGDAVLAGKVPYRDFSLEYPPGALPAFVVPSLAPAADYERSFMLFEAACGLVCVALVGAVSRSRVAAAYCALAPLALGPLALHRYDLWAAALATAGLVCVVGSRTKTGFVGLAAGTAAKIYPSVLAVLALLRIDRRTRPSAATWYVAAIAAIALPFVAVGAGGVRFSVMQQLGRALQIETLGASLLLLLHAAGHYAASADFENGSWNLHGSVPDALAAAQTVTQVSAVVLVWVVFARGPRNEARFLVASAAAVSAWAAFGKVLSPQYLLWLVPLVALARRVAPGALLLAALGLTRAVYPDRYDALVDFQSTPIFLLVARNAVLVALTAFLVVELQRQGVVEEVRAERKGAEPRDPVLLDRRERDGPDDVPRVEPGSSE
jgi:Glycosyltransferase family 87